MATLKVKKVKGHEYFYWSKSVRSHKRFGGDGRVKTADHLIGTTPVGEWLAYYLWSGEVELRQYAQAVLKHLCPAAWEAVVEVSIDWRKYKVSTKSKHPWFADCRSRRWREQRKTLQSWLDRIIEDSTQLDRFVQQAGYLLGEHYRCSKAVEELRQKAREARLYPDNFAPNAEEILDECAHANQRRADQAMEYYLQHIESLEKLAPPSKRLQFRHQVISKAAKLAQDRRWLDQYRAKWERS
jgi:hypothetical protein